MSPGGSVFLDAVTFGAFRECEHGCGIAYRAVMEATGVAIVAAVEQAAHRSGVQCLSTDPAHAEHGAQAAGGAR